MWAGVLIFWLLQLIVYIITYCKVGDFNKWYKFVFFYGAFELADAVANKSDELNYTREQKQEEIPNPYWKSIFIFWWSFSIKYFIPWALYSLMMWNFKADIDLVNYRGYGGYNDMWQAVGFIYPLIGLICFFVPICIVTEPESSLVKKDDKGEIIPGKFIALELGPEEHDFHAKQE